MTPLVNLPALNGSFQKKARSPAMIPVAQSTFPIISLQVMKNEVKS